MSLSTLVLAVALFLPVPQGDRGVPANDGWVTDLAGMLTPEQEGSLEALMESWRLGSGHDVALLTVPDLDGEPIERFALEVARAWKLGSEETSDGALLVVARDDRKLRIEAGRGVEGTLTDAVSGRIIRDVIAPYLGKGEAYEGLRQGILAMQAAIGGDYAPLEAHARRRSSGLAGLIPLAWFVIVFVVLMKNRRRASRSLAGGALPWILLGSGARSHRGGFGHGGGFGGGGGGFSGFGGGGGFSGGGASGGW